MSSMGKATLHLWIVDFKFLHAFIICNRLHFCHWPTETVFCILLLGLRYLFIQREDSFLTYTRNRQDLRNIAIVKSTLKIPLDTVVPYQLESRNIFSQQATSQEGTLPKCPCTCQYLQHQRKINSIWIWLLIIPISISPSTKDNA